MYPIMSYLKRGKETLRQVQWIREISIAAAILLFTLSLLVIYGWWSGDKTFIQIKPNMPSMSFDAALCFFFGSLALFGLIYALPKIIFLFAMIMALLSGSALGHYLIFDFPLNIIYKKLIGNSYEEHMALNTAICFFLLAISLIFLTSIRLSLYKVWLASFFCIIAFSSSLIAFLSYLSGIEESLQKASYIRMSYYTSMGILLFSSSILLKCSLLLRLHAPHSLGMWLAQISGLLVLTISLSIYQIALIQHSHFLEEKLQTYVDQIQESLTSNFSLEFKSLQRMQLRWNNSTHHNSKAWKSDAHHYVQDIAGLTGIAWIDKERHIRWIAFQKKLKNNFMKAFAPLQNALLHFLFTR